MAYLIVFGFILGFTICLGLYMMVGLFVTRLGSHFVAWLGESVGAVVFWPIVLVGLIFWIFIVKIGNLTVRYGNMFGEWAYSMLGDDK